MYIDTSKVEISQNFVAFSEYMNFNVKHTIEISSNFVAFSDYMNFSTITKKKVFDYLHIYLGLKNWKKQLVCFCTKVEWLHFNVNLVDIGILRGRKTHR